MSVVTTNVDLTVDIQIASGESDLPGSDEIHSWVSAAIAGDGHNDSAALEVAVRIVDTDEMQQLNHDFREKDKPTNVLSFAAEMPAGLPQDHARLLGDIVLCAPVVRAEASAQGKALADHWAHLLVHGALHLLGYDHIEDIEAEIMESLEIQILAGRNVADPYRVP